MRTLITAAIGLLFTALLIAAPPEEGIVDFSSERWSVANGRVVDFLGRKAFIGTAHLKDVEFENGVIELDVAVSADRVRSYPGVTFRAWPDGSWERFYIRPHRSGLYGDVLQYVAAFNGVDSWQFYNGPGATAPAVVPGNQWIHVKLEVSGAQARIFLGDSAAPALVIPRLRHGPRKGSVGVMGPADGTAYFSNFSLRADDALVFDAPPPLDTIPGIVRDWKVSKPYRAATIDLEIVPDAQSLGDLGWKQLSSDLGGLVDVSRLYPRGGEPDVVFARSVLKADRDEIRKMDFGYSDVVTIFLNGRPVYSGDSRYQGRDSSFLGIAGWFDSVYLPLRKGDNELTLTVAEASGGWGFMVRDGRAVFAAEGLAPAWETPREFLVPESAAFDPARNCLYVSNYDPFHPSGAEGKQAIARLGMDGRIEAPRWVEGLVNPTGLVVAGDKLFAVERRSIAEIDIPRAKVVAHHPIPEAMLPNDIAAAADGTLYVSDSQRATIFRYANGRVEEWFRDAGIARPNGVLVDGQKLIVGTNADGSLKSIDLQTREIQTIARLGPGTIDGVEKGGPGIYLVSHNEGRLFQVTKDGAIKMLDLTVLGRNAADFAYIESRGLLVIPTFADNRVVSYSVTAGTLAPRGTRKD